MSRQSSKAYAQRSVDDSELARVSHELVQLADVVIYMGTGDGILGGESLAALVVGKHVRDLSLSVFAPGRMVHRYNVAFDVTHAAQSWHWKHKPRKVQRFERCAECAALIGAMIK